MYVWSADVQVCQGCFVQVQERLTREIATAVWQVIAPSMNCIVQYSKALYNMVEKYSAVKYSAQYNTNRLFTRLESLASNKYLFVGVYLNDYSHDSHIRTYVLLLGIAKFFL